VREDVGSIDYNALDPTTPSSVDPGGAPPDDGSIPGQLELPGTTDIGQDIAAAGGAV
jgi:hypothetical protein